MTKHPDQPRIVNAYTAGSRVEALVIRRLLESSGIHSPDPVTTDPFPLDEPADGTHGTEIYVLESQADEARRIIESYQREAQSSSASQE
ncbi:MAG TPA: DUF2007 domain-containing protein [Candidatus Cybelea sp.]|nr:DUF2007 domain-containing protein [Candidatus Cybelea sp.]